MSKPKTPRKKLSLAEESRLLELKATLRCYGALLTPQQREELEAAIQALES
jgi:hypothetical protein